MERKVFLEKNRSKFSVNKPNAMGVDLVTKNKLLNDSGILGNFSQLEQYNKDRDACERFRMIFVINPVCSNVLFNMRTEVVKDEGSDNPTVLDSTPRNPSSISRYIVNTNPVTREQAIKDTEYSHPLNGGFVYHCGADIFNNHMLRNDGFVHVNKIAAGDTESPSVYNTIDDFIRDGDGKVVENAINPNNMEMSKLRLYNSDNLLSFKRAYLTRIKEKDGWIGFTNPSNINIPNSDNKDEFGNEVLINQMLANNKPCEFIDLYPDRSLYSFIPKYNKFKNRTEKNWDYCITYPAEKDTELLDTVCGGDGGAIRADFEVGHNASSVSILLCRSIFKHTLKTGNYINIYYYDGGEFKKYPTAIKITSVGDYEGGDKDRYFSIRLNDVARIFDKFDGGIYYKKVSSGSECEYYFRKYRKLTKPDGGELRSDINKLAFGNNIYGDRVAQVIFLDDININGVLDHMGRPVSEVFLTIVKRNSDAEFSHCFGKVTAGLDFGHYSGCDMDYNIRFLHNVPASAFDSETARDVFGETLESVPKTVEDDITIEQDTFYGDVVEFDPYEYTETEISPVLHRFNTKQRESSDSTIYPLIYDKLESDEYDLDANGRSRGFRSVSGNYASIGGVEIPGNIRPEGYFYNPNTKIRVREDDDDVMRVRAKLVNYGKITCEIVDGNTVINMKAPTSYNFLKWDYIAFYGGESKVVWAKITEVDGVNLTLEVEGTPFGDSAAAAQDSLIGADRKYIAYYANETVPFYASFCKSSQEFCWRGITQPSVMVKGMELFDTPFANGRFYIEKNINFFLRRQDPFGEFGLSYARHSDDEKHRMNPMEYFNINAEFLDLSQLYNFYNNLDNTCY